jgi:RNA polymerase sigma factor (TIGR02999 family)
MRSVPFKFLAVALAGSLAVVYGPPLPRPVQSRDAATLNVCLLVSAPEFLIPRADVRGRLAHEVVDGRRSLLEAAALFGELNRLPPAMDIMRARFYSPVAIPADAEEERLCRQVVEHVRAVLEEEPVRAAAATARLEAEFFAELRAHGAIRLPDPSALEPVEGCWRRAGFTPEAASPGNATAGPMTASAHCGRPQRGVCSPDMGGDVTQILDALAHGDAQAADQLWPLVYDELRRLATSKLRGEAPGQTLQPTALVHEAYLRLVGSEPESGWAGRGHFFAAAAEAMRRILVERARRRQARKRGGGLSRADLDLDGLAALQRSEDLIALDEALTKLAARDPRKAKLVEMRFFAGLTLDETAAALDISPATADRDWAFARAWLYRELTG